MFKMIANCTNILTRKRFIFKLDMNYLPIEKKMGRYIFVPHIIRLMIVKQTWIYNNFTRFNIPKNQLII